MKIPSQNERECGIQAAPRDRYIGQTMVVQNVDTLLRCRWCLLKKQKNTQVLQRKWNKRSTVVLQEEIAKNNEVVCRRMSESQKKGTEAQNIEKTQTKWIRHGWKNRRRSVSRLPCSLLTVYWFGHIYNLDLRLAVSSSSLQVLFNFFQQLLELNAAGPPSDQGHHPGRNCVFFEVVK